MLHCDFFFCTKGSSPYHLCVEYFSQFSFDSEKYTISEFVLKQLLIMYIFLIQMRIGKNIRHKDDRINENSLYAVFLKVYFHKVPSVAVFLCYDNRLKPFQWKNARPFYVLELWVGLNTFHKSYLHLVFITLFTVKEMRCYFS